jgi:predicted metal-dependent hydrolase
MNAEWNPNTEEIICGCGGTLPALAVRGLELFNEGEYFEAHEALELAWRAEHGPVRELYRGVLQIAVAYHHILRGNYRGAVKMFLRARGWLAPFPDQCQGIDLAGLRADAAGVEDALLNAGPEGINRLNRMLMKPVRYTTGGTPPDTGRA